MMAPRQERPGHEGRRKALKGQLVFEFVIATLFFLAIVMYTINVMNSSVFMQSRDHHLDTLESRAWQISEALVKSPGVWSSGVPQELGLAKDWPVLSESKIINLDSWCAANMDGFLSLLDIEPRTHGLELDIDKETALGENNLLSCGSVPGGVPTSRITRLAVSEDGSMLRMRLSYW